MFKKYYLFLIIPFFLFGLLFFSAKKVNAVDSCWTPLTAGSCLNITLGLNPLGGSSNTNTQINFTAQWNGGELEGMRNNQLKFVFKSENGFEETRLSPEAGIGSGKFSTSLNTIVGGGLNALDGLVTFTVIAYWGPNGAITSGQIKQTSANFVIQGTGGICGYINLDLTWVCGNPHSAWTVDSGGNCPSECMVAARNAGVPGACEPTQENKCDTAVTPLRFGCLAPINSTQSTWHCTAPGVAANATQCRGLECTGATGGCENMTLPNDRTNLCGTTITTGGGDGNCGGTGQPACPPGQTTTYPFEVPNPLQGGANTVAELVGIIVKWIFSIAIPIAVAVIVYSGILFLTSKGDPGKVTKAREMLQYAVIGLAIILVGSGFISLIRSILELGAGPTP